MAISRGPGLKAGLVLCCGALALPASASASHMSDMPWCPHANEQGADPAAQQPGSLTGGTPRAAPSVTPIGGGSGAPSSAPSAPASSGPSVQAPVGTPVSAPVGQGVSQSAGAAATTGASATASATTTTTTAAATATVAQAPVVTVGGRTVVAEVPPLATPAEVRAARREAVRQARREARGLARARAAARAERARRATGTQLAARVRFSSPEWWLTRSVAGDGGGVSLPAIGGVLAALLTIAGVAGIVLRRRGGAGEVPVEVAPAGGPAAGDEQTAAVEAELQEIIAEERARRLAEKRDPALLE